MENFFGLDDYTINQALIKGIEIEVEGEYVTPPGQISLVYHPNLRRYILVFGNTAQNAGFVLVEDYKKTWKLK